jgi:hypothetical protein
MSSKWRSHSLLERKIGACRFLTCDLEGFGIATHLILDVAVRDQGEPADSGSLSLSEAVEAPPEDIRDGLEDLVESLPPPQQIAVEELLMQLGDNPQDATIQYKFDKRLERLWNMVIGVQYTVNKHWAFRVEGGLIKRWSLMLSGQYRFGIARRP